MAKVSVDSSTCIGCGQCVAMFEDNFELNDETGTSQVKSQEGVVTEMSDICPVGAIKVVEETEESENE